MGKAFKFKLEKVLEYRGQLEDQARLALARAIERHAEQERIVAELESRMESHMEKANKKNPTPGDLWLWRQYKEALEQDMSVAQIELGRLALKLQKCRQEAVDRSKDRKLLEKLKENQARKHHEQENLQEQKEGDESAALRYKREDF